MIFTEGVAMINRITKGLSLNVMEKNIAAEMSGFEFRGI